MPNKLIFSPGPYVPQHAVAFAAGDGTASTVSWANRLPVDTGSSVAATSSPLAGTASASTLAGPFTPQPGRVITLGLSGSWAGNVQVPRATDGGVTRLPLTAGGVACANFTGNACEPVSDATDAAATFYLAITLTSGALTYRMVQ